MLCTYEDEDENENGNGNGDGNGNENEDETAIGLRRFPRFLRFNFVDPLVMLLEEFLRSLRFLRDLDLHSRFTRGSARTIPSRLSHASWA